MAPRVFTDADFIDAPSAVSAPRVFTENDFLPEESTSPGIGLSSASGYLKGVAGLGDLSDMLGKGAAFINPINLGYRLATGENMYDKSPELGVGDAIRSGIDRATEMPNSTEIGGDTLAHKVASYLPGTMMGGGNIVAGGAKQTAANVAKLLGYTGLTGTAGYVGNEVGGPVGEIVAAGTAGLTPYAYKQGAETVKNLLSRISPEQSAARALSNAGSADIARLAAQSDDPFYKLQTLAESTQSPKLAQLEQQVTKTFAPANEALVQNTAARTGLQKELVKAVSEQPTLARDEAGTVIRQLTNEKAAPILANVDELFREVNQKALVPLAGLRKDVSAFASKAYEAGGMPSQIRGLIEEVNKGDLIKEGPLKGSYIRPDTKTFSYMHSLRKRAQQAWADAKAAGDKTAAAVATKVWRGVDEAVNQASKLGTMSPEDVESFNKGKALFAKYMDDFESGSVGYARQKIKESSYQIPESSVTNTVWNGTAERTRALLKATPEDPKSLDQLRGVVRDKIIRDTTNNDGNFSPAGFRKFLRTNKEGLTAKAEDGRVLFEDSHITDLERVANDLAFLDPSSSQSVKQLAFAASKGQPTTAQALMQKDILKGIVQKIPGGNYVVKAVEWGGGKIQDRANALLTRAIFDKEFAKELIAKATPESLKSVLSRPNLSDLTPLLSARATNESYQSTRKQTKEQEQQYSEKQTDQSQQSQVEKRNISYGKNTPDVISNAIDKADAKLNGRSIAKESENPLFKAVKLVESNNKPNAVSKKGAVGLMQVMPDTAKEVAGKLGLKNYDLKDPATNEAIGTYYLTEKIKNFKGNIPLALAAYNAGEGNVRRWIKKYGPTWKEISAGLQRDGAYSETVAYVPKVQKVLKEMVA